MQVMLWLNIEKRLNSIAREVPLPWWQREFLAHPPPALPFPQWSHPVTWLSPLFTRWPDVFSSLDSTVDYTNCLLDGPIWISKNISNLTCLNWILFHPPQSCFPSQATNCGAVHDSPFSFILPIQASITSIPKKGGRTEWENCYRERRLETKINQIQHLDVIWILIQTH